jgi:hypothetical protein
MNKNITLKTLVIASIISIVPIISSAKETIEGKIVGYSSLFNQSEVPVDSGDPHIQYEEDFVLLMPDGEHFILQNIPRNMKVKYFDKTLRAVGTKNVKYHSMAVVKLELKNGNDYETVWKKKKRGFARTGNDHKGYYY